MIELRTFALFLIASCTGSTWAAGSNVYKCGATYSQTPCEGAVEIQVGDNRSKDQKSQSDAATVQQNKTANAMEKARLKQEAQAYAQGKPAKATPKLSTKAQVKGKKKEDEFFVAKEANIVKKK